MNTLKLTAFLQENLMWLSHRVVNFLTRWLKNDHRNSTTNSSIKIWKSIQLQWEARSRVKLLKDQLLESSCPSERLLLRELAIILVMSLLKTFKTLLMPRILTTSSWEWCSKTKLTWGIIKTTFCWPRLCLQKLTQILELQLIFLQILHKFRIYQT